MTITRKTAAPQLAFAFDRPEPRRILDGTSRTHADDGAVTVNGKAYRFRCERYFDRHGKATPGHSRTSHECDLFSGRQRVRLGAMEAVRAAVLREFRFRIQARADRLEAEHFASLPAPEVELDHIAEAEALAPQAEPQATPEPSAFVQVSREDLEALRELVDGFHACRQIRAWAADENVQTKRAALLLVERMAATQEPQA